TCALPIYLGQALAVAQVDEDDAAMVAAAMDPSAEGHCLVQVLGRHLAGVGGPHRFGTPSVSRRRAVVRDRLFQVPPDSACGAGTTIGSAPAVSRAGGAMTPIDTTYFSASSTPIASSMTWSRGIIRKKPDVGLGVVGTYTDTMSARTRSPISPAGVPVWKAIVQTPCRGYCTNSTLRKAWPLPESSVSLTCLTLE